MKKFWWILSATALCAVFCSCALQAQKPSEVSFEAMDTFMSLKIYGENSEDVAKAVQNKTEQLEAMMSAEDENSDIFKANHADAQPFELSEDTADIVQKSLDLCKEAEGSLDITIYPVVCEWGFISKSYKIPRQSKIDELLKSVDYKSVKLDGKKITLLPDMQLDLGAVAKGYAADKGIEICKEEGVSSALLNFGGTVAAVGTKPDASSWKIGIADPENRASYFGYLSCKDTVAATSGGYERCFTGEDGKTYIHIIDPQTGQPVDNDISSVTIVSPSGLKSDALSTALFVMGIDGAREYQKANGGFDFVILSKDNEVYVTSTISQSFTLAEGSKDLKINIVN